MCHYALPLQLKDVIVMSLFNENISFLSVRLTARANDKSVAPGMTPGIMSKSLEESSTEMNS